MLVILKKIDEYFYKPFNGATNLHLEWLLGKINKVVEVKKYNFGIGYLIHKGDNIWPRFAIHDHQFSEYFGEFNFDKYFEETDF